MKWAIHYRVCVVYMSLVFIGCASSQPKNDSGSASTSTALAEPLSNQKVRPVDLEESAKWLETGRSLQANGDIEGALDAFELSIQANHNQGFAYLEWAVVAQDAGVQDEFIIEHFEKAVRALPKNPRAHYLYGFFLESIEQTDGATERYEEAIALRPEYLDARSRLAATFFRQHQWAKAVPHYQWVLTQDQTDIPALIAMAEIAEKNENLEQAETYLRTIVQYHGQHPGHHLRLIRFFERHHAQEKADHAKRQLQIISPKQGRKLRTLK